MKKQQDQNKNPEPQHRKTVCDDDEEIEQKMQKKVKR